MADVVYFDGGIDLPFCPPTVNGIYISGSGCCSEFYSAFIGGNQTYNLTYTLPTASGSSGQVLTNDGNGNLSWTTVSGGGGGTGTLTGTGTTNYLSKWVSASGLTDSIVLETGSTIDISGALRVTASSGTATAVMGRDANGYISNLSLGNGLSISGGTLSFTGSTGVSGNFVPYLGATGNTDLGGYGIAGSYFQLSTSTGGTLVPGMFSWNGTDGTADLMLKGGTVTLPIGETQLARVINETGANLLKSQYNIVRVNGSTGTRLKVALALASGDATSAETLGIVAENIALNQEGFVITSGIIRGINTTGSLQGETWLDGDMLFLSPFVAGALTNIKPQAPNHLVVIGYVVTAANNGVIYVKVDNGYELDELHNVLISSAATNEILAYDGVASVWKNRTSAQLNLASGSGTATQVAFWGGATGTTSTALTSSTGLTWDNVNGRLGVNISTPTANLHVRGTTLTDGGILGAELLSSSGWTSTGWTGDYSTGFTHNTGNTSTLSNSLSAVTNSYYQLTYTVSNRTAGEFTISFGGVSYNSQIASNSQGIRATSTAILNISPTTDFNGKIQVSIKDITEGGAVFNIENSNGIITNQIKASLFTSNLFLGLNSGNRITTGTGNAGFGTSALRNNTSGTSNTAIGISVLGVNNTGSSNTGVGASVLANNTIGIGNTAIGTASLSNNVNGNSNTAVGVNAISSNNNGANNTAVGHSALNNNSGGDNNTAIGVNALRGFTSSAQNIGIGADAGYNATTNKTGTGNILIGYEAGANISSTASNNLVIGKGISLPSSTGSDQLVIKNIIFAIGTSGTATNIAGRVGIGISSPSSRLHIRGSGNNSTSTSFLVQNSSSNNMFSILDNGNIGINTNNPQQTLHIEGTMCLTGSTGDSTTIMGRNASGDVSAISIGSGLSLSGNTLSSTGGGGGSGTVTGSGTATQVAFWSGATGTTSTALTSSTGLTWDNTNIKLSLNTNYDFVDKLVIKTRENNQNYSDSPDLLTTGSGTNWNGVSYSSGYTHITGSTATLTANNLIVGSYVNYNLFYTITNRTSGGVTISLGGLTTASITSNTSSVLSGTTTNINNLTLTPTTNFDGTVTLTLIRLNTIPPTISLLNNNNSVGTELRVISQNILLGINAGSNLISGNNNIFIGNEAGKNVKNTGGLIFIGNNAGTALSGNTQTSNIIAIGNNAYNINTTNFNNYDGIFIGSNSAPVSSTSNNEIVIGHNVTSVASGAMTLGGLRVHIINNTTIGSSTADANTRIKTTAPSTGSTSFAAKFQRSNGVDILAVRGDGLVGINTISPNGALHVLGTGTTTGTTFLTQSSGGTNTFAVLDNGQIGVNTATPNTSSIFQIDSTTLGFLPPRMSTTNKIGIASPAQGLVVYDTTMQALSAYNGSNWATVGGGEQMFTITGSTATINFNAGNIADITLATSTTLTLTGGTFGTFIIKLTQDATGGRVVSWPSNVRWSGGIPPSLTTTGGKVDVISLIFDGTNYYGTYALNF